VTVYSTFHNSCACCAVSRSTRGFGAGLRSAKGRPSRRSSIAFRPLERAADCGARATRVVVAASSSIARSAAKSGTSEGTAHQPRDHTGLSAT